MTLVRAASVDEAVEALWRLPGAAVLAGGTEVVPAAQPPHLVSLRLVPGLRGVLAEDAHEVVLGAMTTYTDLTSGTGGAGVLTALAPMVGTPASRNTGTLGGALGTASGSGDAVTALLALDAGVLVERRSGAHRITVADWLDGSGREVGDLVRAVAVPRTTGRQVYLKAGERSAVFYATASCALVVDAELRRVRCAVGSVAPSPLRAGAAEHVAAAELDWDGHRPVASAALCRRFGEAVAEALPDPPDGLRVSGGYRRHVAGVLAARALARAAA